MLCQRCNEKEASVHLTKIVNGEKTELFLCKECAEETGQISFESSDSFSFQNLLAGILKPQLGEASLSQTGKDLVCENCGLSYSEFSQEGLMGCSRCYDIFGSRLDPLVKRIHGSTEHQGKVPQRRGGDLRIRKEIDDLKKEMQKAVDKEEFERAAEIRDQIKELKQELGGE